MTNDQILQSAVDAYRVILIRLQRCSNPQAMNRLLGLRLDAFRLIADLQQQQTPPLEPLEIVFTIEDIPETP